MEIRVHHLHTPPIRLGQNHQSIHASELYSLKVLDELHKPIKIEPLDDWQNRELGVFEVKNLGQKYPFFLAISIFSSLGDNR